MESTKVLLSRKQVALAAFASKEGYGWSDVHVTKDYAEATNGSIAMRVQHCDTLCAKRVNGDGLIVAKEDLRYTFKGLKPTVTKTLVECHPPGNKFPDIDKVLPSREGRFKVALNARLLKLIVDYALKHGGTFNGSEKWIEFYFDTTSDEGDGKPIRFEIPQPDSPDAVGVLMPIRSR